MTLPHQVGPYLIDRELGRGGMGVVYAARHAELGREVALKLLSASPDHFPLRAQRDPAARARFQREAQAAARLDHPGIVRVYDVELEADPPWIAMELVRGRGLDAILREKGLVAPPLAARWARQVAQALDHAHAQAVVHRDVKPSNIIIRDEGTALLVDFGLARDLRSTARVTLTGLVIGTPAYLAPELATGGVADGRVDVWALGVTLYQMLTGALPFAQTDLAELLTALRYQDPLPPSRRQPGLPRELEAVCLRALEKRPADRYPSAGELAADLGRFLEGEAVRARVPGLLRLWVGRARRRPARLLAGALSALLPLAVLAAWGASEAWARIEDSRRRATWRAQRLAEVEREGELRRLREGAAGHERRGWQLQMAGDVALARSAYQRALELAPEAVLPRYQLARLLVDRPEEAAQAVEALPDTPEGRALRSLIGIIAQALPNDESPELARMVQALAPLEEALALLPDFYLVRAALRSGRFEFFALSDGQDTRFLEYIGDEVWRQEAPAILDDLGRCLDLDPQHAPAYRFRAWMRAGQRDLPGARADLDRALAISPGYLSALRVRIHVQLALGAAPFDELELKRAVRQEPGVHLEWAALCEVGGDTRAALEHLDLALAAGIEDDGDRESVRLLRMVLLAMLGEAASAREVLRGEVEGDGAGGTGILKELMGLLRRVYQQGGLAQQDLEILPRLPEIFVLEPSEKARLQLLDRLIESSALLQHRGIQLGRNAVRGLIWKAMAEHLDRRLARESELRERLAELRDVTGTAQGLIDVLRVFLYIVRREEELVLDRLGELSRAEDLLARAAAAYRAGKLEQAEADLRVALLQRPRDAGAHYALATVLALRGRGDPRTLPEALNELGLALDGGFAQRAWARADPDLSALHAQARFRQLVE